MENYILHKSKKRVFLVLQTPLSVALWLKRPAHTVPGQGPDSNLHHVHLQNMFHLLQLHNKSTSESRGETQQSFSVWQFRCLYIITKPWLILNKPILRYVIYNDWSNTACQNNIHNLTWLLLCEICTNIMVQHWKIILYALVRWG